MTRTLRFRDDEETIVVKPPVPTIEVLFSRESGGFARITLAYADDATYTYERVYMTPSGGYIVRISHPGRLIAATIEELREDGFQHFYRTAIDLRVTQHDSIMFNPAGIHNA
jgi:hypothetical protein